MREKSDGRYVPGRGIGVVCASVQFSSVNYIRKEKKKSQMVNG